MSQLDNFRKSLGLPNPDETDGDEMKKEKNKNSAGKRSRTTRTVALREDTYLKLRAIILWMMLESRMERPTIDIIIGRSIDALQEKEPDLHEYLKSQNL